MECRNATIVRDCGWVLVERAESLTPGIGGDGVIGPSYPSSGACVPKTRGSNGVELGQVGVMAGTEIDNRSEMTVAQEARLDDDLHDRLATPMLWLTACRILLGVAILPAVPWLWENHYLLVAFLRPTKEVLLAGGFFVRRGDVGLIELVLVSLPLLIPGVWVMYGLGVAYKKNIEDNDLQGWAGRILQPQRVKKLQDALKKGGVKVVFLGRLAMFPSSIMAVAAGSSGMPAKRFFVADGLGALASVAEVLLAGYLLGEAYAQAGIWITATGAAVLVGITALLGRQLWR